MSHGTHRNCNDLSNLSLFVSPPFAEFRQPFAMADDAKPVYEPLALISGRSGVAPSPTPAHWIGATALTRLPA